jgi:UDP-N-acetylglucosamine--N-acetylmuramyl-(pentapeptide) pyrophosphoryl-undecaprenol N-acetylglucosamine transferase
MNSNTNWRVLISGGGTGGHIFPAIAIAHELRRQNKNCELLFVGAKGRMEMEKVPQAGYRIIGLDIAGMQRRLTWKNLLLPFKIWKSVRQANRIVREFKPQVAVGVGGYASGPTLYACHSMGIPTVLQEQNLFAGITNRLLSKRAKAICVAYDGMAKYFPAEKLVLTGNPVREEILAANVTREWALQHFGLSAAHKTILVMGGSLGARTINESILGHLHLLAAAQVQVIWQTGNSFFSRAKELERQYPWLKVTAFISRMDAAYAAADVIVSRAGALSVSELCIAGKPVLLVPSPIVAEDHQTHNAMALVSKQAAVLVKDAEARQQLVPQLINLLQDAQRCNTLAAAIRQLAMPDATKRIVEVIKKHLP